MMEKQNSATILEALDGKKGLWQDLVDYLEAHYNHEPVVTREGKERSLTIRYRKGGKTLVTLYPKENEFVVLVVLGKEEVEKAKATRLNKNVKEVFEKARQYHEGRWLWIKPRTKADIESIFKMLALKRKPKD